MTGNWHSCARWPSSNAFPSEPPRQPHPPPPPCFPPLLPSHCHSPSFSTIDHCLVSLIAPLSLPHPPPPQSLSYSTPYPSSSVLLLLSFHPAIPSVFLLLCCRPASLTNPLPLHPSLKARHNWQPPLGCPYPFTRVSPLYLSPPLSPSQASRYPNKPSSLLHHHHHLLLPDSSPTNQQFIYISLLKSWPPISFLVTIARL